MYTTVGSRQAEFFSLIRISRILPLKTPSSRILQRETNELALLSSWFALALQKAPIGVHTGLLYELIQPTWCVAPLILTTPFSAPLLPVCCL